MSGGGPFGGDGLDFRDLLDLVNPLQHIPVVGAIYRRLTGDAIAPAMRIAGGALFGGPLGAAFASAGVLLRSVVDGVTRPGAGPPAARPQTEDDVAPGGWMVAASRRVPAEPAGAAAPQVAAMVTPPRRGGWMAQAAYAMADARAASRGVDTVA